MIRRIQRNRQSGSTEMVNEMLKSLRSSLAGDLCSLFEWKLYWPKVKEFPFQLNINEKLLILGYIADVFDDLEEIPDETFGPFKRVKSRSHVDFIADIAKSVVMKCAEEKCIEDGFDIGWRIASKKKGTERNNENRLKHRIILLENRHTGMGLVLLVFNCKYYTSIEMRFHEAEILFKEYSKGIL